MTSRSAGRTCDTSVLVPALATWHRDHESVRRALNEITAVPAHVLLETYSVLTRLPSPHRVTPADAAAVVSALRWDALTLPASKHRALVSTMGSRGIRGGATYDALVAATALHHGCDLLSRDRRAASTYDLVGATYQMC